LGRVLYGVRVKIERREARSKRQEPRDKKLEEETKAIGWKSGGFLLLPRIIETRENLGGR
jgi:hypothetical protein